LVVEIGTAIGNDRPIEAEISSLALPTPRLRHVYRLRAELAAPLELGEEPAGRRRLIAFGGGRFAGPEISGTVLPGGSADWQLVRPGGSAVVEVRYTLQTDSGSLILVRSDGVRHGEPEVLARLSRGEEVAPDEYTFRAAVQMETADPDLAWLNDGVFVGVGAREAAAVVYDVHLVD
jgi:Protein of unknown function (DUF3237)